MKSGGGKAKGGAFERRIAKALSQWVSKGQRDDIFWRSSMSGGRATVAKKSGKLLSASCGDLSAIDPLGKPFLDKYYVEIKHVKSYKLDQFLVKNTGKMAKAWAICVKEAKAYSKQPLLIANLGRLGIVIVVEPAYFSYRSQAPVRTKYIYCSNPEVVVSNFEELLQELVFDVAFA
jgi:hypothetical protein